MLDEAKSLVESSQSNSRALNSLWKKIWSINVPNKIKNFLWQACHEALPTKKNLCHQRVYITPLRHGRMHKWLNLDFTRGMAVRKGRGNVG